MFGHRRGWPLFHLTLEERRTCPRSCTQWLDCYGNAMPFARRHSPFQLEVYLEQEIATLQSKYPEGFLIRLHTLGDFFSVEYVSFWARMLVTYSALHVFGYTSRRVDDPDELSHLIAVRINAVISLYGWRRFAIRTSHAEAGPQRSIVVLEPPVTNGQDTQVIMCPAQSKATEACVTCGLCWAEAARGKTIAFLKHGMKRRGKKSDHGPVDTEVMAG